LGLGQCYRRDGCLISPEGRVGGLAFLVTCGLLGMALALVGVHVYELVRQLNQASSLDLASQKPDTIANALMTTLRDVGPIIGLATAVYLLAPAPDLLVGSTT
jgi:hypothetical protein